VPGHSNETSRHAITHPRPRRPYPGSRSGHGGERTGFQFAKSYRGYTQSPARSQYFERPNTCAVACTFAVDERQRTGAAARSSYDAATCAAAAHLLSCLPAELGPFRFSIPDGSLAKRASSMRSRGTARHEPVSEHQSKWQPHRGQAGLAAQFGSLSIYRLISVLWNSAATRTALWVGRGQKLRRLLVCIERPKSCACLKQRGLCCALDNDRLPQATLAPSGDR
jgi:hypothetical protein